MQVAQNDTHTHNAASTFSKYPVLNFKSIRILKVTVPDTYSVTSLMNVAYTFAQYCNFCCKYQILIGTFPAVFAQCLCV